jgi:hypothetical protein
VDVAKEFVTMSVLDAIAGDVRAWYDRYLKTFTSQAAGESTNVDALLEYFGAPLVFISEDRYLGLPSHDAVLSTAQTLIDELRRANCAGSTVHRLDIRPLNVRAAFIEGVFSRYDRTGNEIGRFGTAYLVARTEEGWRFTSIVFTRP